MAAASGADDNKTDGVIDEEYGVMGRWLNRERREHITISGQGSQARKECMLGSRSVGGAERARPTTFMHAWVERGVMDVPRVQEGVRPSGVLICGPRTRSIL